MMQDVQVLKYINYPFSDQLARFLEYAGPLQEPMLTVTATFKEE